MNADLKQALVNKLLAMADDEIILAHRNSEWTGHAPILEEDIAFSNIAQDEIGHAVIWYTRLSELAGEAPESYPDQLVFFRDAPDYRNVQLVELPKGDWAFTVVWIGWVGHIAVQDDAIFVLAQKRIGFGHGRESPAYAERPQ